MRRMSTLYVVSTPIGNLEDLTARAARILGEVDRVVAEDTRRTGILLKHLGLRVPMTSLHDHNEASRVSTVIEWLEAGESVALVSDAGTPLVSDPGGRTVAAVRDAGHNVVPIPGPSAVLAALVGSGLPADRFAFLGFVPRKGEARRETLRRIDASAETLVVFESPERLWRLLSALGELDPERPVAVARELTKLHEDFRRGTAIELAAYYEEHSPRGEVTVVIAPAATPGAEETESREEAARARARELLAEGGRPSAVAKEVAKATGIARNRVYLWVQELSSVLEPADDDDREKTTR